MKVRMKVGWRGEDIKRKTKDIQHREHLSVMSYCLDFLYIFVSTLGSLLEGSCSHRQIEIKAKIPHWFNILFRASFGGLVQLNWIWLNSANEGSWVNMQIHGAKEVKTTSILLKKEQLASWLYKNSLFKWNLTLSSRFFTCEGRAALGEGVGENGGLQELLG